MGWFAKKFEQFRRLPPHLMFTHVLSKFVFGVGFGALLAFYLSWLDWQVLGWALVVLSIIIGIPSLRIILKRR